MKGEIKLSRIKADDSGLTEQVLVRLTREQKAAINQIAQATGITASEWVRAWVSRGIAERRARLE